MIYSMLFSLIHVLFYALVQVMLQMMYTFLPHDTSYEEQHIPDSKDHGANMGPTWVL